MARIFSALAAGLIFGLGLSISQMIDPVKVLGFLDIAGNWDPSLALVMASAVVTYGIGYRLVVSREAPLFEETFQIPTAKDIDRKLVGGSLLFGIGWGLVGLCPGPAVTGLAFLRTEIVLFVASMVAGMLLYRVVQDRMG